MIYLLHGTGEYEARKKLHELLASLFKKRPDALYFHITNEDESSIEEMIGSQGLFEQKYIVVYDHIFSDAEKKKEYVKVLKEFKESPHVFIFLEGKLDAKTKASFEKYAEKVQEFVGKETKKETFNVFSLTDALGRRDRKTLWTLYQKAEQEDVSYEEIHGILFWQIKSLLLAQSAKSASEAGLNPFVFRKSLGFLKNFTELELKDMSARLVRISHDAHRGVCDFGTTLERFILRV
jgi:DNA polymerase III delta subunit